jgi:hypothetical protein
MRRRVEEILRIRLDGAEWWDCCEFVREKEQEEGSAWHLADGDKPLSEASLRRYLTKADQLIAESCRASRKKVLRRHLAQRRNLYAKAVSAGDYRTALAASKDEAELLGLYDRLKPNALEAVLANLPAEFARQVRALLAPPVPAGGDPPGSLDASAGGPATEPLPG